ncbi:MAG: extracellular solute-binding protein [Chitinivibrionales bacterium]|nr:extracellular solute-binding protein [Chitinivibrionales bacterium]
MENKQSIITLTLICCILFTGILGCRRDQTLLFHAGAGQRSSLEEIQALFQKKHPDIHVNFSFKGSGYFIADIARSKEGDLFMPGEEFYVLQAVERGFVTEYDPNRDIAAHFVTVILTPRGNPKKITGIHDFAQPGIRVGLGNPKACAIGIWHEKIFKRAGIWEKVQGNASFSAKCVPELGNAAQHNLVDATIVWATTAVLYLRDVEIIPMPPEYRGVIRLPIAQLTFSTHHEAAQSLKQLILSDEGKKIFLSHAYAVGTLKTDSDGFLEKTEASTEPLMKWLVNAAAMVKDTSRKATRDDVGPLSVEVTRQQKTIHAGN